MNMAVPDDEVDGLLAPKQEREQEDAKRGNVHLPKFVPPQLFDGTMKDTKSFVSSLILYIYKLMNCTFIMASHCSAVTAAQSNTCWGGDPPLTFITQCLILIQLYNSLVDFGCFCI